MLMFVVEGTQVHLRIINNN